jgi:hypothetical protein
MRKLLGPLLVGALLVTACGGPQTVPIQHNSSPALEYTCGTTATPPIAAAARKCTAIRGSSRVTNGHRWYTAVASDVNEPSERPKIGKPLDGDWWDPKDKAEDE